MLMCYWKEFQSLLSRKRGDKILKLINVPDKKSRLGTRKLNRLNTASNHVGE